MKRTHPHKKNVLLVNITRLGDMLQATPTIAGLKMDNPDTKVSVLVEKQFEEVCHNLPGIDEVLAIDLGMTVRSLTREQDGIIDAYEYITEFVEKLRKKNFDYCLNMSSSAYTALLLKLIGIERNGGWVSDEEGYRVISSDWARLFATSVFHQNRQLNSLNLVDVFRCSADVEQHPQALQFSLSPESLRYADELLAGAGFTNDGPIIAIQAGASQGKRQWATQNFVRLVRRLVHEHRARVVLVGTKKELALIEPIKAGAESENVFIAAGKTNIPQLAALLKRSAMLVTGDTGTMHVSVSVGTPVVAMFLASAYGFETGPYGEGNIVLQPVISCGPCNPNKPCVGLECHDTIHPETLAELAMARIKENFKELPAALKSKFDPRSIIVYRSTFDEHGFCDLTPLTSAEFEPNKKYRDAYRKLWLSSLGGLEVSSTKPPQKTHLRQLDDISDGLGAVVQASERGTKLIAELKALIKDPRAAPRLMGEVNQKLSQLDRDIEELGFTKGPLGPLTRMFIFAKENLSGSEALDLASQMGSAYEQLGLRARSFGEFLAT